MSDTEYGLVMPFVVCESQGGPYADVPFTAGYECGRLDGIILSFLAGLPYDQWVRRESLPQIDLIAMSRNYAMTVASADDSEVAEEWAHCSFTKQATA